MLFHYSFGSVVVKYKVNFSTKKFNNTKAIWMTADKYLKTSNYTVSGNIEGTDCDVLLDQDALELSGTHKYQLCLNYLPRVLGLRVYVLLLMRASA